MDDQLKAFSVACGGATYWVAAREELQATDLVREVCEEHIEALAAHLMTEQEIATVRVLDEHGSKIGTLAEELSEAKAPRLLACSEW